jgi:hypothetical protein
VSSSLKVLSMEWEDQINDQLVLDSFKEFLKTYNYSVVRLFGLDELQGKYELLACNNKIELLHDQVLERKADNDTSSSISTTSTSVSSTTTVGTATSSYHLA